MSAFTLPSAVSAWWSGERLRTSTDCPKPGDVFCDDVATNAGGRVALISQASRRLRACRNRVRTDGVESSSANRPPGPPTFIVEPDTDYVVKVYRAYAEKSGPSPTLTVRTFAGAGGLDRAATGSAEPARHRDLGAALDLPHDRGTAVPERRSTLRRLGGATEGDTISDRFRGDISTTLRATSRRATRPDVEPGTGYHRRSCIAGIPRRLDEIMVSTAPVPTVASPRAMRDGSQGSAGDCSGTFSSCLARGFGGDRR